MDYYTQLLKKCNGIGRTEFIGKTVAGYDIPVVLGKDAKTLIVGSVHGREHITTDLILGLFGQNDGFDLIPCLNIDGVILAKYGLNGLSVSNDRKKFLLQTNGGKDFSLWKANLNAVDLNVNFDAFWGQGKQNVKYPSSANYIGTKPMSEPETIAVSSWIKRKNYAMVVAYHSKGEIVYWGFGNNFLHYDEAKRYADSLGYEIAVAKGSTGGLKDWYDLNFYGLGLTVEVGNDKFSHPYPIEELPNLISLHKRSVEILYENAERISAKIYGGSDKGS